MVPLDIGLAKTINLVSEDGSKKPIMPLKRFQKDLKHCL